MPSLSRAIRWSAAARIVSTRIPSVAILERLAAPGDAAALVELDAQTNPRLNESLGAIAAIAPRDRVGGPGGSVVMAPFAHVNPQGSRFSDGTFGVFYAARRVPTAIAEVRYHRERFLSATRQRPQTLQLMLYEATIGGAVADIRKRDDPGWYDPDSYRRSQPLGVRLHRDGSNGIVYRSVRDPRGQCVAVFRPRLISGCRPVKPLFAHWDGTRITAFSEPVSSAQ